MIERWREEAPAIADECAQRWSLRLGEPYGQDLASLVLRAELADGTPAVLKVAWPHLEAEHEAAALAHYGGRGAVRLLAHDPARNALLLERCEPGTSLLDVADSDEAFRLAARLLPRLWRRPAPGAPFRPIADEAARWEGELERDWERFGRPFERELVDAAVAAFRELPATQGEPVVCHQDLHRGNVLRAGRERWLAIDPKPVVAEREFDTAALVRDGPGEPTRRLDLIAAQLGLDRERMRRWALGHALAWGFDETGAIAVHVGVARSLLAT